MNSQYIDAVARSLAYVEGRAIPIRRTSMLAASNGPVFGIAPIKVVSEQRVQAIAFGYLGAAPRIVVSLNPLNRESGCLESFAKELDTYLTAVLLSGGLPRIWLPYKSALELIEILGHRHRTNPGSSPGVRRMGWQCRALTEEATYPHQQVVAIAGELLRAHVRTGQQPVEDAHLGAILAWINPPAGANPSEEAERRALTASAAMLERQVDDRIEHLRKLARGRGARAELACAEISSLLTESAQREWAVLVEARRAFAALKLPPERGLDRHVEASRQRISYALERNLNPPSTPHALSRLLDSYEFAAEMAVDTDVCGDDLVRERARRKGRVVRASVHAVNQPYKNRHPCELILHSTQEVLRVRRDTQLKTIDGSVIGRVTEVREGGGAGGTFITLKLKKGVTTKKLPRLGTQLDWSDSVLFNSQFHKRRIYRDLRDAAPTLVYGMKVPPPRPRLITETDLLAVVERLKRP